MIGRMIVLLVCLTSAAVSQAPPAPISAKRIVAMEYLWFGRMAHIQGSVDLVATISREGAVTGVRAVSGPPLLAEPAKETLSKWQFTGCVAAGGCEARFVFSFALSGTCSEGSRCPSEFELDLPDKVLVKSGVFDFPMT